MRFLSKMDSKAIFIDVLRGSGRDGIDDLIEYLEAETDFFTAPASTRHHGAVPGGLVIHSLAVLENLTKLSQTFEFVVHPSSLTITALLHDLCKANYYKASLRNVKNESTGEWEKQPYYLIEDQFPLGHGEKSAILAMQFISLSAEELLAIRWHMGAWDDAAQGYSGRQCLNVALTKNWLVGALHMADTAATYFDNK